MPHENWYREHGCDLAVNDPKGFFVHIYQRSNRDPCEGCGMRPGCETFKLLSKSPAAKESGLCSRCRKETNSVESLTWFTKKDHLQRGVLCKKCERETADHRLENGRPDPDRPTRKG